MLTRRLSFVLMAAALVSGCSSGSADTDDAIDASTSTSAALSAVESAAITRLFADAGVEGTFVARRVGSEETVGHDLDRAAEPRLPASTYKILNSLIILETGTLASVDETVSWDGEDRGLEVWNRDHSLRSGIEVSAVWLYQAMAAEVGVERMQDLVAAAGYGNAAAGPDVTSFWLRGDLRISPMEQLEFLEGLATGDLPFADEHLAAVRDILVRETGDGWTWSHKTGTALATDPTLGWLVGTTEYDGATWVFALNLDLERIGPDGVVSQLDPQVRQDLARASLIELGALPGSS